MHGWSNNFFRCCTWPCLHSKLFTVSLANEINSLVSLALAVSRQPVKDWASCLPCHSNSTAWLYDSVRFINNYPISFGQESWCNLWWPAALQRAHCKDCSILQVCTTQHQKDQALSDRACCKTSCPGPGHFQAGLLQCSSGWTSIKHNQTSTNDLECSGTTGLQWAQKSTCFTFVCLLALVPGCSSHQV